MFNLEKHTKEEVQGMLALIESSIEDLYRQLNSDKTIEENPEKKASMLISKYRLNIEEILNKPYGGTLAPEEMAEIIFSQETHNNSSEEAATKVISF